MDTMTLTINLPEDVGTALRNKAQKNGQDVGTYVETLIATQVKRPTYRELFTDVRDSITVSDEELEKHIDRAVAESRKARR
jgi:hypothetical protein